MLRLGTSGRVKVRIDVFLWIDLNIGRRHQHALAAAGCQQPDEIDEQAGSPSQLSEHNHPPVNQSRQYKHILTLVNNFSGMPELGWKHGYPATLLLMAVIAGGLLWIFKRKGWFD